MKPASWVIVNRETGKAVLETFSRRTANRVNLEKYEVVPIREWLARVNVAAKNPPPRRTRRGANIIAKRVLEIRYVHQEDGEAYRHEFAPGVVCEVLPDGSARLYRPDGKPVWKNFL